MRFTTRVASAAVLIVLVGSAAAHAQGGATSPGRAEGEVSYEAGKFGLGIRIDGPGERVAYPTAGILDPDEGTLEVWVKTLEPSIETPSLSAFFTVYYGPFDSGPPTEQAMMLFLKNDRDDKGRMRDQIALLVNGINGDTTDSFNPLGWGAGEWHHIAAVWGDGRPELFVDGKPSDDSWVVDAAQWTAALFASNTVDRVGPEFSIGTHDYQGLRHAYFPGVYDELRVSKRARDEDEIAATFAATGPLEADGATTLLEHFEGVPPPPLRVVSDRGFNRFAPGEEVNLRVRVPGLAGRGADPMVSLVATVEGDSAKDKVLRIERPAGTASQETTLRLGAFARAGVHPLRMAVSQDGATLTKGEATIWVAPPVRAKAAASPFGETGVYNFRQLDDAFFADLAEMGGRWSRIPLGWGQIECDKGTYRWEEFDRVLARAERYGVELVPTFVWTSNKADFFLGIPAWAGSHAVGPPKDWADFFRFAGAAAARYKGRVHYWSVWNEPNLDHHWGGDVDAAEYAEMLKGVYQAVKAADPGARVIGLSTAFVDLDFAEAVFAAGAKDAMDVAAVHLYRLKAGPDDSFYLNPMKGGAQGSLYFSLAELRKFLERHGKGQIPIWVEETGYPSEKDVEYVFPGVGEDKQARWLATTYAEALAAPGVERVLWFDFRGISSFELSTPAGAPKLAAAAYRNLALHLDGKRFKSRDRLDGGVTVVRFERTADDATLILWSTRGVTNVTVRSRSGGPLHQYDHLGRGGLLAGGAPSAAVRVTNEPVLVVGDVVFDPRTH